MKNSVCDDNNHIIVILIKNIYPNISNLFGRYGRESICTSSHSNNPNKAHIIYKKKTNIAHVIKDRYY